MWIRSAAKYLGGLLLMLLLIWWVLRGTDLADLRVQLGQVSVVGLVAAAGINFGHNAFRVWRWGALLHPVRESVPFRPMFDAVVLGYLVTWTVPGRLGEVVRPALLSTRERIPLGPCLGSILTDRVLDGVAVLGLFAIGLALTPIPGGGGHLPALGRGLALALILMLVPAIGLLAAASQRSRLEAWLGERHGVVAWVSRSVLAFARGTEALWQPRLMARIALHSLLAWLMIAVGTWIGVRACGAEVSLGSIFVILPLLALGVALPTPGGAGGYHAAMKFGLVQLCGVRETVAVGAAILMHLAILLPVLVLGTVLLFRERLSPRDLLEAARGIGQKQ